MDSLLKNIEKSNPKHYYKSMSAIEVLKHTPLVFEAYKQSSNDKGDVILHIYGLLQNMFVSVDALYDLSRLQMHYKYNININQNEILRKVKHIRNDIVGHPTHRTYESGGVGYSLLNLEKTSLTEIHYETHFFQNNHHEVIKSTVDTYALMDSFIQEANQIIEELKAYNTVKVDKTLSTLSYELANNVRKHIYNEDALHELKEAYIQKYDLNPSSHNRILWRLRLLEKCFAWHDLDQDINDLIEYLTFKESMKIVDMFAQLEGTSYTKLFKPLPKVLKEMYKYLDTHKDKRMYTKTLLDHTHMYYKKDLEALSGPKIIGYLASLSDGDLIYLVGKSIHDYQAKSK